MQITYHREAEIELIDAMIWYEEQRVGLSDDFLAQIQIVESQIAESPKRWPEFSPGFRKLNTNRFPYRLIYRILSDSIQVVAVMHHSRHPDCWKTRLKQRGYSGSWPDYGRIAETAKLVYANEMRYAMPAALLSCQLIGSISLAEIDSPADETIQSHTTIPSASAPATTAAEREQIGTCHGVPVHRDQIVVGAETTLGAELHRHFTQEPFKKYYAEHKAALEPSDAEIEFTTKFFMRKQRESIEQRSPELRTRLAQIEDELAKSKQDATKLKKLENEKSTINFELTFQDDAQYEEGTRSFVKWWLQRWKLQRHLYDNYGGGRILWQQAGLEAFDAHRKWIESLEAKGEFTITDAAVREKFYLYWTREPQPFLSDKPETIKEFLTPEWALPAKPD